LGEKKKKEGVSRGREGRPLNLWEESNRAPQALRKGREEVNTRGKNGNEAIVHSQIKEINHVWKIVPTPANIPKPTPPPQEKEKPVSRTKKKGGFRA